MQTDAPHMVHSIPSTSALLRCCATRLLCVPDTSLLARTLGVYGVVVDKLSDHLLLSPTQQVWRSPACWHRRREASSPSLSVFYCSAIHPPFWARACGVRCGESCASPTYHQCTYVACARAAQGICSKHTADRPRPVLSTLNFVRF